MTIAVWQRILNWLNIERTADNWQVETQWINSWAKKKVQQRCCNKLLICNVKSCHYLGRNAIRLDPRLVNSQKTEYVRRLTSTYIAEGNNNLYPKFHHSFTASQLFQSVNSMTNQSIKMSIQGLWKTRTHRHFGESKKTL